MMQAYRQFLQYLPEVTGPTEKNLSLMRKLKWTGVILLLYFILKTIALYGLGANQLAQFTQLALILGADFGSIISLGIGPIVTASIVLQLVNGSGLYKFNLQSADGKKLFQGTQKLLTYFFIVFEAIIYVMLGGLAPDPALAGTQAYFIIQLILIAQLCLGGFLIMLMDELCNKWGIGSGVSLFIAASVSEGLVIQLFSFIQDDTGRFIGAVPGIIQALSLGGQNQLTALFLFAGIFATVVVFVASIYAQSMKIEIPLSFGRVRGYGIRWPLNFMYTSVLPVILIAALLANIQLGGTLLANRFGWDQNAIIAWVFPTPITQLIFDFGGGTWLQWVQIVVYMIVLIIGATVFSYFWVQTSGMDARAQAKNIMAAGLQVPGFRRDPRVLEQVLNRYIPALTIMGGALVGFLAALADVSGALSRGTGILLAVMVIYKFYEDIARKHMMDLNPAVRKFMGKQ